MKHYSIHYTEDLKESLKNNGFSLVEILEDTYKQVKSMQAWDVLIEIMDNFTGTVEKVHALQSYNTMVAWEKPNGESVRTRKYSPTTSKQTTTWENGYWRYY